MNASLTEIRQIIAKASTVPSGDNCQPWSFRWDGERLEVFHDDALARHALNNGDHATLLSFGCLLELLRIAASELGLETLEELAETAPEPASASAGAKRHMATLRLPRTGIAADPLAPAIQTRLTDRRPFARTPLSESLVSELETEASRFPRLKLSFRSGVAERLADYIVRADEFLWKNPLATRDFLQWVRLSRSEEQARPDGLPWKGLGIAPLDLIPLHVIRKRPHLVSRLWHLGFKKKANRTSRRLLKGCSGLYCIAIRVREKAPLDPLLVETGRLAFRCWLTLHRAGMGVQPLSIPSLTSFDVWSGVPPFGTTPEFERLFREGRGMLHAEFALEGTEIPVWLFRTGPSDPRTAKDRAPRKPVDQLLTISRPFACQLEAPGQIG